jgi:hypothetical protein
MYVLMVTSDKFFVKVAIEESNRGIVVLINSYPDMLLSDSFELDL